MKRYPSEPQYTFRSGLQKRGRQTEEHSNLQVRGNAVTGDGRHVRQQTALKRSLVAHVLEPIKILFQNPSFGGKEGNLYRLMELQAGKEC